MAASVPLTDDGWQPLDAGTVLVLRDGEVIATRQGWRNTMAVAITYRA